MFAAILQASRRLARRCRARRAATCAAEQLERRTFLSSSLSNGVLTVDTQSTGNDSVTVATSGGTLRVTEVIGGQSSYTDYTESQVNSIVVHVQAGNDTVTVDHLTVASRIATTLDGAAGNDSLYGGDGNDSILGGDNDDVLQGFGGADTLSGGGGSDTVDYGDKSANLAISLDGAANDGAAFERDNVGSDIEVVIGGSGNDAITGDSDSETLKGGDGNDTLVGGAGADVLQGENGSGDTADYSTRTENLSITLDGNPNDGAIYEGDDVKNDVETIIGGSGSDNITGTDFVPNRLEGRAGSDTLRGGDGSDGSPDDSLFGGTGNDICYGGSGDDYFEGGDGNDLMIGDSGADFMYGGAGDDYLYANSANNTNDSAVDTIWGEAGTDEVWLTYGTDQAYDCEVWHY